jgi:hypothetical protein
MQVKVPGDVSDAPVWISGSESYLVALRFDSTQLERVLITPKQILDRATWLDGDGSSGDGV